MSGETGYNKWVIRRAELIINFSFSSSETKHNKQIKTRGGRNQLTMKTYIFIAEVGEPVWERTGETLETKYRKCFWRHFDGK